MPGALEAKRLNPEKHVIALCGDGGFMMSIQALATGVRTKTPFIVVLWEDDHYGLIKWKQKMHFEEDSHTDLHNENLALLAQGFGCHAVKLTASDQLIPALNEAFGVTDRPSVIVVPECSS